MPSKVTTIREAETVSRKKTISIHVAVVIAALCLYLFAGSLDAIADSTAELKPTDSNLQEIMRAAIADPPRATRTRSQRKADQIFLEAFYADRDYRPAWLTQKRLAELQRLQEVAFAHGLPGEDGPIAALSRQIESAKPSLGLRTWAHLDVMTTLTIARLICDLRFGYTDPTMPAAADIGDFGRASGCGINLVKNAARSDSLAAYLDSVAPLNPFYNRLKISLAEHRRMANHATRPRVANGRILKIGMADNRVLALRARLGIELPDIDAKGMRIYDDAVAAAVQDFQEKHRLDADGMLGRRTVTELNVTIPERIDQIRANMEWQRWALNERQSDYLLVNVAHFVAHLVRDGTAVWSGRIQVGRRDRPTPMFKTSITSIIANPTWTIPPTILRKDILPEVRQNKHYLNENGLLVVDLHGRIIDSPSIDWHKVTASKFTYRVRAKPGPLNALGRIKFRMPNSHMVYIHDTPAKSKFDSNTRLFSSGCIRLENPAELAERLLSMQPDTPLSTLNSALASGNTSVLRLARTLPVIVTYNTIEMNASGELIFGPDVYGRDAPIVAVLDESIRSAPQRHARAITAASAY